MRHTRLSLAQILALAAFTGVCLFAQAPPATQPPPAAQPTPPAGPPPLPLTPRDPASAAVLTRLVESEKQKIHERDAALQKANDLQSRITALDQAAQDQISEIKKAENWGADVSYDGEKERFERAGRTGTSEKAKAPSAHRDQSDPGLNDYAPPLPKMCGPDHDQQCVPGGAPPPKEKK